jgi:hypothetical protein
MHRLAIALVILISGVMAHALGGTPGTGSVSFSGYERTGILRYYNGSYTLYDCGHVSVTVNGHTTTAWYGLDAQGAPACNQSYTDPSNDTSAVVAARLAAAVNSDSASYVTASVNGSTITLTSKATGSSTNYPLSATSVTVGPPSVFPAGSTSFPVTTSGPTLTGGSN